MAIPAWEALREYLRRFITLGPMLTPTLEAVLAALFPKRLFFAVLLLWLYRVTPLVKSSTGEVFGHGYMETSVTNLNNSSVTIKIKNKNGFSSFGNSIMTWGIVTGSDFYSVNISFWLSCLSIHFCYFSKKAVSPNYGLWVRCVVLEMAIPGVNGSYRSAMLLLILCLNHLAKLQSSSAAHHRRGLCTPILGRSGWLEQFCKIRSSMEEWMVSSSHARDVFSST